MNDNRNDDRWVRPEGRRPARDPRQGQYPQGQRQAGQYPQGQRQAGQYPQSQRQAGQYPQGRRQAGQYPQGRRPNGRYPNGQAYTDPRAEAAKKKKRSVLWARIALTAVLFLVIGGLIFWIVSCNFKATPDDETSSMKMTYGKETFKIDKDTAYRNGELYFSFTKLAEYLDLEVDGDADSVRFVFASADKAARGDGEEYAEFFKDDRKAVISGNTESMSAPAYFSEKEVFVPVSFIERNMNGLTVEIDTDKNTLTIKRELTGETDDEGNALEAAVTMKKKATVEPASLTDGEPKESVPEVTFTADLSAYEKYMMPDNDSEYLVLVNKTHTVGAELKPDDLIDVVNTRKDGRDTQMMRECAEKALEALYIEMEAAGFSDVSVTSAYRSYEYQDLLYSNYVSQEMAAGISEEAAMAIVDTYSARPGTSEHQTGLCCDMHNLPSADQSFEYQDAYGWLKENAWKFGFIERFPKGKEDVTGYSFEPWHYRFVGRRAAAKIHEQGITLEEYLGKVDAPTTDTGN